MAGSKGGRPTQGESPKRSPLSIKVDESLRASVEAAASENRRSLTQEIEDRLWRTLRSDHELGGPAEARLFRLLAAASDRITKVDGAHWTVSPNAHHRFREAMIVFLGRMGAPSAMDELRAALAELDPARHAEMMQRYHHEQMRLYQSGDEIAESVLADLAPDLARDKGTPRR